MSSRNTSGYIGVYWNKKNKNWFSAIGVNKKFIKLGTYKTKEEALMARISKEIELFGEQKTNLGYTNKVISIDKVQKCAKYERG